MIGKVWIKKNLVDEIMEDGIKFLPTETGGILMGYCVSECEYVITDLIMAGARAKHGMVSFSPDQLFHQKEIKRIYSDSQGLTTYLGDWHTHPNSIPYMSVKDKIALCRIANFKKARLRNPLMLIAAPPKKEFKVYIYSITHLKKVEFVECEIILFQ